MLIGFSSNISYSQTPVEIELIHLHVNNIQFQLNITPSELPTSINLGDNLLIEGKLKDVYGAPVSFGYVGINDGMGLFSSIAQSNVFGEFIYQTTVLSDNSIRGPRQILFYLDPYDVKTIFLPINISQENALFNPTNLDQLADNLSNDYNLGETEVIFVNEDEVPLWYGPSIAPSYLTINNPTDVNQDNYYLVLNQAIHQTNPWYTKPEIWNAANYYLAQDQQTVFSDIVDDLGSSIGYARLGVYVGGGLVCLSSAVPGNAIGPVGCGLIINMAAQDVFKYGIISIMEWVNFDPQSIEIVENTLDISGLLLGDPSSMIIEGTAMGIDALMLENEVDNSLDVINQAYWNNQNAFSGITIEQVGTDQLFFQFNYTDESGNIIPYQLMVNTDPLDPSLYDGIVNPNQGGTSSTFYFSTYFKDPTNQAPQYVKTVGSDWQLFMTGSGGNYKNGIQFTASNIFTTLGTYSFYFEAKTASNEILRYPETGYLTFTVSEDSGPSPYPPSIEITSPNFDICHDECYIIWNDVDPDDNAVIFLYYDNTSNGLDGTCINANNPIFEDNAGDSYVWNTVNMPEGNYWIYATIDDGTTLTSDYSPGYIEINHPDLNSDFSYSSKSADEDDGDGDGIIESGESFDLDIWIRNLSYITTYSDVNANLTTTNPNVTITDNDSYYGVFEERQNKKGNDNFDIQVDEEYEGNVSFQLNLTFEDESGYLYYQVLDIPSIHITTMFPLLSR